MESRNYIKEHFSWKTSERILAQDMEMENNKSRQETVAAITVATTGPGHWKNA